MIDVAKNDKVNSGNKEMEQTDVTKKTLLNNYSKTIISHTSQSEKKYLDGSLFIS